ncbi:hypothetical protein LguiA_007010 [Lonicera macranthoides]
MDSSICLWIWFDNVPHPKLIEYKKDRNWMCNSDDCLIFPGGDTQLKDGVRHYIYKIEQTLPAIEWGQPRRVVLDVGCGVASFGGFTGQRLGGLDSEANLLTLPIKPHAKEMFYKDTRHWFALASEVYTGGIGIIKLVKREERNGHECLLWKSLLTGRIPYLLSFDRVLVGIYHNWCKSFNAYPRSFDLLHSSFLFRNQTQRAREKRFTQRGEIRKVRERVTLQWCYNSGGCFGNGGPAWSWSVNMMYMGIMFSRIFMLATRLELYMQWSSSAPARTPGERVRRQCNIEKGVEVPKKTFPLLFSFSLTTDMAKQASSSSSSSTLMRMPRLNPNPNNYRRICPNLNNYRRVCPNPKNYSESESSDDDSNSTSNLILTKPVPKSSDPKKPAMKPAGKSSSTPVLLVFRFLNFR